MKCLKTQLFAGLLLSSLALPQLAHAVDCTVQNGNDSGAGSLRDCIAGATDDGDIVTLPANLTINLSNNIVEIHNSIKIVGAADGTSIIDGSAMDNNASIFYIFPTNNPGVEISGVTLQNAHVNAIRVLSGTLLKVSGSNFNNNHSLNNCGGAIYNEGSLFVDSSEFILNDADAGGGAICNISGSLNVKESLFQRNSTTVDNTSGGAIYQEGGIAEIIDSKFEGNYTADNGDGGAIFIEEGLSSIVGASFESNKASHNGGAIVNFGLLEVRGTSLTANEAGAGGAIYEFSQTLLENCQVSDNMASILGGAVASTGNLIIRNSVISGNKSLDPDNNLLYGAGIATESNTLVIENSNIINNEGSLGAGMGLCTNDALILNSTIANNKANQDFDNGEAAAGGINISCGDNLIINSTLSSNQSNSIAGAIYNNGNLVLNNVTISDNIADADENGDGAGGGIYNLGKLTISNSILANNQDDGTGPDCATPDSSLLAAANNIIKDDTGCTIQGNVAGVMNVDPLLDPAGLADNGGPTQTIALTAGSPALDGGDDGSCEKTDQRGVARPQGASCDLGAYEAGPMAELAPDLDFGEIELDSDSTSQIVTLTNTGLIPIDISNINIDGDFSQTNNCGATLEAGTSCQFEVIFSPTATGIRNGSLSVETSAGLLSVNLTGIGIEPAVVPNPPNPVDISGSGILSCSFNPKAEMPSSLWIFLAMGSLAFVVARKKQA